MRYTYWLHEKVQTDLKKDLNGMKKTERIGYEFLNAIEKTITEIVAHPERFGSKGNLNYREALLKRVSVCYSL